MAAMTKVMVVVLALLALSLPSHATRSSRMLQEDHEKLFPKLPSLLSKIVVPETIRATYVKATAEAIAEGGASATQVGSSTVVAPGVPAAPATDVPVSDVPVAPATDVPVDPATDVSSTDVPAVDAPAIDVPATDVPATAGEVPPATTAVPVSSDTTGSTDASGVPTYVMADASGSGPTPPPPNNTCPPTGSECDFYFTGFQNAVPTFKIPTGGWDAVLSPAIEASVKGSVVNVIALNSQVSKYICNSVAFDDDNQFYVVQDVVQMRTIQPQDNGTFSGIYVKIPITSAQIEVYNQVFNLNPGDGSSSFPEDRRCVIFQTS